VAHRNEHRTMRYNCTNYANLSYIYVSGLFKNIKGTSIGNTRIKISWGQQCIQGLGWRMTMIFFNISFRSWKNKRMC